MRKERWRCRTSNTLGALEGTPEEAWGVDAYSNDETPAVFFGLYGLPDFYDLWRHEGRKAILWCGSDILNFVRGYWLDFQGNIKLCPKGMAKWIMKNCESWVENEVERRTLNSLGIESKVCPSFLGNTEDFPVSFVPLARPRIYTSVSGNNFKMYGWDTIERIADKCNADFFLYGSDDYRSIHPNVAVRGRIVAKQMNVETREMQSGLRLTKEMDGFSEITAKSILWGQYPIVRREFSYPYLDSFSNDEELIDLINSLGKRREPNPAREYYKNLLNDYPWNSKLHTEH